MRLKKTETEMIRFARICRAATANRAGAPHCVPVCPLFDDKRIYFSSDMGAKKVRNLRQNPAAALIFDDYTDAWSGLRGVMIQGEAKIIERGPLFRKIRRLLYEKYPQYEAEAPLEEGEAVIVEVTPKRSFSWGL